MKHIKARVKRAKEAKNGKFTGRATTRAKKEQQDIEVAWTDGGVPETERQILSVIREEDEQLASMSEQPNELHFEDIDAPKSNNNDTLTD